jgi:hypothetical protein
MFMMGEIALAPRQLEGEIGWYLGATPTRIAERFATGNHPIVLSGGGGAEQARRLRVAGYDGEVLVDPREYEELPPVTDDRLFDSPIDWEQIQVGAGVSMLLSPGRYVPEGDRAALEGAVATEVEWAAARTGAAAQVAIHWSWLTGTSSDVLRSVLAGAGPTVLLLADSNDPLSKRGAVEGLAAVLSENPNVAVHRCDLGALGAVALGAPMSTIGITASVRHVVPVGKKGGGIPNDRSPSVFDSATLCWLKGSKLGGTGSKSPTCDLDGCDGRPLSRFFAPETAADAVEHNRHAVEAVAGTVLGAATEVRLNIFRDMCAAAEVAAAELQQLLRQEVAVSPQRAAWATLWI